jgi:erythromycin esterase-like protein
MLGESGVHGFGKTLDFKVELVRRLVSECHYNALFIESPTYDFIHIQQELKSGREVYGAEITAAIGGLWATKEVQPLIPFLKSDLMSGSLTLGGLDDQLGRGTWAVSNMVPELARSLPDADRSKCVAELQGLMQGQAADKAQIVGCLNQMKPPPDEAEMIDNLKRMLSRDLAHNLAVPDQRGPWANARDHSMYLNFTRLLSQMPPHSKVIMWAATVHLAKGLPGSPSRVTLGSYIRHDFGDQAFALGFTAYSGSYVVIHPPVHQLSIAPSNSLESRVFGGGDAATAYLTLEHMRGLGSIEARPLEIDFVRANWDEVLDGLVVFREERPPTRTDS